MSLFNHFSFCRKGRVKKVALNCAPPLTGDSSLDTMFAELWTKGKYRDLFELSHENRTDEEIEYSVSGNKCHDCKMQAYLQVEVRAFAVMKFDELLASNQNPQDFTINLWTDYDDVHGVDIPLMTFINKPQKVFGYSDRLQKRG